MWSDLQGCRRGRRPNRGQMDGHFTSVIGDGMSFSKRLFGAILRTGSPGFDVCFEGTPSRT